MDDWGVSMIGELRVFIFSRTFKTHFSSTSCILVLKNSNHIILLKLFPSSTFLNSQFQKSQGWMNDNANNQNL